MLRLLIYFFFSILPFFLFGQKGELYGGINLSPGIHPNSNSEILKNRSLAAGIVAHYQITDKLGLMIAPNLRSYSAVRANDYCYYLCASRRKYSSLETNAGLTLSILQNSLASSKLYLQLGYSFQQILRVETDYYFPADYSVVEWMHEITGHTPFFAFDFAHHIGEKYRICWGLQYTHPISLKDYTGFPLHNPSLLANIRFARNY